jgi:hypothetical protein
MLEYDARVGERRIPVSAEQVAAALVVLYLVCVAAFEVTRHVFGTPSPRALAATPAAIAEGKVWLLMTSGFLVSGEPAIGFSGTAVDVLELIALALAAALVVERLGAIAFWRAAVAGHVGGALLVYAALGVVWLVSRDADRGVVHKLDYGVSAVWMALLGALMVFAWRVLGTGSRRPREVVLLVACAATGVAGATLFSPFVDAEHGLAFALGGLVFAF